MRISRKHKNLAEHDVPQKCEICEEVYSIKQKAMRSVVCSSWPAQHVLLFSWLTDIQTQKYRSNTLLMKKVIVSVNFTLGIHSPLYQV